MKLRNKKTGVVVERTSIVTLREHRTSSSSSLVEAEEFGSIEELNENLEDYEPVEPLIKDEKIRKAVRAWAEVNELEPDFEVRYSKNSYALISWQASIEFNKHIDGLEKDKKYTITELCGEEKE